MTADQAVALLRSLASTGGGDPEVLHSQADAVLLKLVPDDVRAAYEAVVASCSWWAFA